MPENRNLPKILLDTNVLLVSVSDRSRLHWVYRAFRQRQFVLCLTTEILTEYAEILAAHMGVGVCEDTLEQMLAANNVSLVTPHFRFNLLRDPDDNKFVDCAIAARADLLVTHDRDFDVLRQAPFPVVPFGDVTQLAALLAG